MKIAIIYASKHGFTEKCANILAEGLSCKGDVFNIKKQESINIDEYDIVVLGSSVYAGRIQKSLSDFIKDNENVIKKKHTGIFTCNMHKDEEALNQIEKIFPNFLKEKSFCKTSFGGKFDFSKMNFLEKKIIKKIAKTDKDVENIEIENIKVMQDEINDICLKNSAKGI